MTQVGRLLMQSTDEYTPIKTRESLRVHCGHCGYNLFGAQHPRCPECGHDYGTLWSLVEQCGSCSRRHFTWNNRCATILAMSTAAVGIIVLATAWVHYWSASSQAALQRPEHTGVFSLAVVGETARAIVMVGWAIVPIVCIVGGMAIGPTLGRRFRQRDQAGCAAVLLSLNVLILLIWLQSSSVGTWLGD